jgi:hypothetical protein
MRIGRPWHLRRVTFLNFKTPNLNSFSAKEFYEGTIRLLMEHGATVLEHVKLLETGNPSK